MPAIDTRAAFAVCHSSTALSPGATVAGVTDTVAVGIATGFVGFVVLVPHPTIAKTQTRHGITPAQVEKLHGPSFLADSMAVIPLLE